jgi:tripeptide aminopeptidase
MNSKIRDFIKRFHEDREIYDRIKETLLSNLVMISETPAPTFREHSRARCLVNRYISNNLLNCYVDELGNALGIIPGKSDRNIILVAHLDTFFSEKVDHTVTILPDTVKGAGVADDSLGLAALATLPYILETYGIEPEDNIILMGSSRSLGRGDLEGLRFFLDNFKKPITAGVCVEGVKLGRLSYSSIGMLRGEINYKVPESYDWTKFNSEGAIINMNDLINKILEIPTPSKPKTSIVLGSIEAGTSYNTIPTRAKLKFEVRSESDVLVEEIAGKIENLTQEITSLSGAHVEFKHLARRSPGGTEFSHPLNKISREIQTDLKINTRLTPSTSELAAFIDKGIPAVTIGLTDGENMGEEDEMIQIQPLEKGLTLLVGLILAIDGGYSHDN